MLSREFESPEEAVEHAHRLITALRRKGASHAAAVLGDGFSDLTGAAGWAGFLASIKSLEREHQAALSGKQRLVLAALHRYAFRAARGTAPGPWQGPPGNICPFCGALTRVGLLGLMPGRRVKCSTCGGQCTTTAWLSLGLERDPGSRVDVRAIDDWTTLD